MAPCKALIGILCWWALVGSTRAIDFTEPFQAVSLCAPVTAFIVPAAGSTGSVVFSGDADAVATLKASVSNGVLAVSTNATTLTTSRPLLANITVPASSDTKLAVYVAGPAEALIAANFSLTCLTLSAANSAEIRSYPSVPALAISAANAASVVANASGAAVSVNAADGTTVALLDATSAVRVAVANGATVGVVPAPAATPNVSGTASNGATVACSGCNTAGVQTANGASVSSSVSAPATPPKLWCFSLNLNSGVQWTCKSDPAPVCPAAPAPAPAPSGASGRKLRQVTITLGGGTPISIPGSITIAGPGITGVTRVACKSGPTDAAF